MNMESKSSILPTARAGRPRDSRQDAGATVLNDALSP